MLEVWAEKYRPKKLSEIINQRHVVERVKAFVKEKSIPHMLFAGPAGTGKCVEGKTPIILADGLVKPINEIKRGDYVLSLSENGAILPRRVNKIIEKFDRTVKITTKLGNEVEVTREHPFLTLSNGSPRWKEASQIEVGDFVGCLLRLNIPNTRNEDRIDFTLLNNFFAELKYKRRVPIFELFQGKVKILLRALYKKPIVDRKELHMLGIKSGTLNWCLRKLIGLRILKRKDNKILLVKKFVESSIIPLTLVKSLRDVKRIAYKNKYHNFSIWIKPFSITPQFCEWLGYVLSEGSIDRSRIIFNNKNPILLKRFKQLTKKIFGINCLKHPDGLVINKSTTIVRILKNYFDLPVDYHEKSFKIKVPKLLFRSSNKNIARFIRAYLDGDGFVGKNGIEIYSNSKEMLLGIKLLLLRFSIVAILSYRVIKGKKRYKLTISGRSNVFRFKKNIGSLLWNNSFSVSVKGNTNKDIMEIDRKTLHTIFSTLNIKYTDVLSENEINYVFERGRASRSKVQRVYQKVCEISRKRISRLMEIYNSFLIFRNRVRNLNELNNKISSLLDDIKSIEIRKLLQKTTGIRYDGLLEYNQRKHLPNLKNLLKILKSLSVIKDEPKYKQLYSDILELLEFRKIILEVMSITGVSYNDISAILKENGGNVNYYLNEDGLTITSLNSLLKIFNFIEGVIESRIFDENLIDSLEVVDFLSKAEIFWDRVEKIEEIGVKSVNDLSIEGSHNFVGGYGALILHNTTTALAIAHELYGKNWRSNILETNASDERGIQVVRGKIKDFARTKSIGDIPYKLIILDEADNLTSDAQQALRRTMEMFSRVSRFCLICNYSSKIIDPIRSRCAVFRFKSLSEEDVIKFIQRIVKGERLKISKDGVKAVIEISEGDLRKVANLLQASAALGKKINEDVVYEVASRAKPTDVKEMLELALEGEFEEARKKLQDMLLKKGLAGSDIISEIHKQIYSLPIEEEVKVKLIEKCGEYEFRISEGGNELIQLTALLTQFLLLSKKSF